MQCVQLLVAEKVLHVFALLNTEGCLEQSCLAAQLSASTKVTVQQCMLPV